MEKLQTKLINLCRKLRTRGYSIGEIASRVHLSKSTVHRYGNDIFLSLQQKQNIKNRAKERNSNKINPRKGKCLQGKMFIKPESWSTDLVHIVSHFMFDGRIDEDGCIYYSKDRYQICHMMKLLGKVFSINPNIRSRDNGVKSVVYYNVEFAAYIKDLKGGLLDYLNNGAPKASKAVFLKAFFDDEGSVFYKGDKRRVRGYQKSKIVLRQIIKLLDVFGIKGRIDHLANGIEISGKRNIAMFSDKVNFSPEIYINPDRKNGIWKERISKREILSLALKSFH